MMASAARRQLAAIAIGGSAGGVDALSVILPALRPDCGVAVAVVLHLQRERRSLLADIFAGKCQLEVVEAEDKQPVEPGTIYFAPPDYHLLIDVGPAFALAADELVHFSRPSIDVLLESAADAYRERLLGVVLSGANQDGAAGLKAVEDAGGLTLVQQPETASSAMMPTAALHATKRSSALDLRELAQVFGRIQAGWLPDSPAPGAA